MADFFSGPSQTFIRRRKSPSPNLPNPLYNDVFRIPYSVTTTDTSQAQASDDANLPALPAATSQAQASDTVVVTPSNPVALTNTSQTAATSVATITEHATVAPSDSAQAQTSSNPTATSAVPVDTSQAQTSANAVLTEHATVALTETQAAQSSATTTITSHNVAASTDTAQAQASGAPTVTVAGTIPLTDTAQAQVSGTPTLTEAASITLSDSAQAQFSSNPNIPALTVLQQPTPFVFRRGSRILPQNYDRWFYPSAAAGTAAVQASDATVTAVGGKRLSGDAAVQADDATVNVQVVGVSPFLATTQPVAISFHRRDRNLIVVDEAIYIPTTGTSAAGNVTAVAQPAVVVATGERVITGSAVAISSSATASASDAVISGAASATASAATVSATGEVVRVASGAVQASNATVSAVAVRVITGTATVIADAAFVTAVGGIQGIVSGNAAVQAGSASTTGVGVNKFFITSTATALPATVNARGQVIAPIIPVLADIETLLSRVYRSTTLEFSRYLTSGTEPITYTVSQGVLPSGLILDSATGIVSGTPDTVGVFNLAVTATNITGSDSTPAFNWAISKSIPRDGLTLNQNIVAVRGL